MRPERAKNSVKKRREVWWQFTGLAPELAKATAGLSEVLAVARVSKAVMPVRVSTSQVFSNTLYVFATDSYSAQAVLSSSLHQIWAITYGATMGARISYTVSDVFETFPRPPSGAELDRVGRTLDDERREIMRRRNLGLTKLYNLVNDPNVVDAADPDVARMRAIHVELDSVVMDAYGWRDVSLGHGFDTYRQVERWTVSAAARVEILDRLIQENHKRAAAQGSSPGDSAKGAKRKSDSKQAGLFE